MNYSSINRFEQIRLAIFDNDMEKVGLFISKFFSHLILYEVQFSLGVWNICTDFKEIIRLVPTEETAHTQYFWLNVAWKILRAITVDLQYSSLLFWQDPLYDMREGSFEPTLQTLKVIPQHWASEFKQIWCSSCKWSTLHSCRSKGHKKIKKS